MGSVRRIDFRVTGRVQGVGFRWATRAAAQREGVLGWVRNEPDGAVCGAAQGDPDAVAAFVEFLREGPAHARVALCEVAEREPLDGEAAFLVER